MASTTISTRVLDYSRETEIDRLSVKVGADWKIVKQGTMFGVVISVDPVKVGGKKQADKTINSLRQDIDYVLNYT